MWLVVRLFAALIGFWLRYHSSKRRITLKKQVGDLHYRERIMKSRGGQVVYHRLGILFERRVVFSMHAESTFDRFFKAVGISEEFQTGDGAFDEAIYVASDHPAFCAALRDDHKLREILTSFLAGGGRRKIWSDGKLLYFDSPHVEDPGAMAPRLRELAERLAPHLEGLGGRLEDPFLWRAFAVEAVVWSIAGYAIASFLGNVFHPQDHHVRPLSIVAWGMGIGIGALGALTGAIAHFLKKSSRGHRILLESAIILMLALPVAGTQLASDINRHMDRGAAVAVEGQVTRRWVSRSNKSTSYHVQVHSDSPLLGPVHDMRVHWGMYESLREGDTMTMTLGRGRLGAPWYKTINGQDVTE